MHASSSSASLAAPVCRICWDTTCEANGSDEFLRPTPCACRDERSNVHQYCLERWILEARSRGRFENAAGVVCHACGSNYSHPALERTVLSPTKRSSSLSATRPTDVSASAAHRSSFSERSDPRIPVALIGGTGFVGRSVALSLLHHPQFRLGAVVGSASTAGKPFSAVFEKKEDALAEHYGAELWKPQPFPVELLAERVRSVEEVIDAAARSVESSSEGGGSDQRGCVPRCPIALSFIAPEHGELEDQLAAAGIKVFSISPHARFDPGNPLSVPEANPECLRVAVRESLEDPSRCSLSLVKSPNCVTCGVVLALRALEERFGTIEEVAVTTFQSLSGRGDAKYPRDAVLGNVYPLRGTVERTGEYQRRELRRIMPGIERVSVAAYRVPVQKGHLVDVRVNFKTTSRRGGGGEEAGEEKARRPSAAEIVSAFESFDPLRDVPLPSKPRRPIVVNQPREEIEREAGGGPEGAGEGAGSNPEPPPRAGAPRPRDDCEYEGGMAVCVGNVDAGDECFDVAFCLVVNNVARGAWGAALLNAEYWAWLEKEARKEGGERR